MGMVQTCVDPWRWGRIRGGTAVRRSGKLLLDEVSLDHADFSGTTDCTTGFMSATFCQGQVPAVDNFLRLGRHPPSPLTTTPARMNRLIPTMSIAAALVGIGVYVVFLF